MFLFVARSRHSYCSKSISSALAICWYPISSFEYSSSLNLFLILLWLLVLVIKLFLKVILHLKSPKHLVSLAWKTHFTLFENTFLGSSYLIQKYFWATGLCVKAHTHFSTGKNTSLETYFCSIPKVICSPVVFSSTEIVGERIQHTMDRCSQATQVL